MLHSGWNSKGIHELCRKTEFNRNFVCCGVVRNKVVSIQQNQFSFQKIRGNISRIGNIREETRNLERIVIRYRLYRL